MARHWVGGTGSWDASDTTHWSASSGGAGGASVPTSSDDVVFDTASNATAYTVTIAATANCRDLTIGNPLADVVTLAGSAQLNIAGSLSFAADVARTFTGIVNFTATSGSKTITMNSVTFASQIRFVEPGSAATWTFVDNFQSTSGLRWQTGNLTVATVLAVPSIDLTDCEPITFNQGAALISLNGTGTVWDSNNSNLTVTPPTTGIMSIIDFGAVDKILNFGGNSFGVLRVRPGGDGFILINGSNSFTRIEITAGAGHKTFTFEAGSTTTLTGTTPLPIAEASRLVNLQSSSSTPARITVVEPVDTDWISLINIALDGNTPAFLGDNSTDGGGNSSALFKTRAAAAAGGAVIMNDLLA